MYFNSAEEAKEALKSSVLEDMEKDPGQSIRFSGGERITLKTLISLYEQSNGHGQVNSHV